MVEQKPHPAAPHKQKRSPARTVGTKLPVLPDLTGKLEQSLLSVFEREQRKDTDIDTGCPFGLDTPPVVEEAADDQPFWAEPFAGHDGPLLQIIDARAAEAALTLRLANALPQDIRRISSLTSLFQSRGNVRKLATLPPSWRTDLNDMALHFPNFLDVINYLRAMFALAFHGSGVPLMSPILLAGPPGVGKTHFAMHFAQYMGAGFQTVHMETAQTSSILSGSDEHWGNTKTGAVFNALIEADYANPVFFLDEIDKAFEGEHDPLMSLYALLETTTAKAFTDSSYPWLPGIDASRIVWVCTCNDVDAVPPPLLDRMRRFDIAMPTIKQGRKIVEVLMRRLVEQLPAKFAEMQITTGAIDALTSLSPRQAQAALLEAVGTAAYRNRTRVSLRDIARVDPKARNTSRIGFLE